MKELGKVIKVASATNTGYELAKEGDSVNFSMIRSKTRRGRVGKGIAQTIDTAANQAIFYNKTLRRFTEIECERLQGFKDNHTQYGLYPTKKITKKVFNRLSNEDKITAFSGELIRLEISRGVRYKLCGNAVTVNIVEVLATKLKRLGELNENIILVSLFSGIDGFAEGLLSAGVNIKHHYFSEIDQHAIANLKYNFPNAEYIGSVTDISGTGIRERHPNDTILVTFGWPCQDNSIAGKRKGQRQGTRSGLLFEAGRIINEIRPRYFFAENVKGLFSVNKGYDFYESINFLSYLNTSSSQYTIEMQLLNTAWVLPQNRERTYFIGHYGNGGGVKRILPIAENDRGIINNLNSARKYVPIK